MLFCLLCVLGLFGFVVDGFVLVTPVERIVKRTTTFLRSDNNNNNNDIEFFDDFADMDADYQSSNSSSNPPPPPQSLLDPSLSRRLSEIQQAQRVQDAQIRDNWQQGQWKVRGFSLDDTTDAQQQQQQQQPVITVSCLAAAAALDDESESLVWVGRSNGSLILVRLGLSEWVARFTTQLALEPSSTTENAIRITSKLVRDDVNNDNYDDKKDWLDKFDIACQCQAYEGQAITHVVATADKVWTVAQGSNDIIPWILKDNDDDDETFRLVAQPKWCDSVHGGNIVALHAVADTTTTTTTTNPTTWLTSVASDGTLAIWDIDHGDLLFTYQVRNDLDEPVTITAAHAGHGQLVLGTAEGKIFMYTMAELVESGSSSTLGRGGGESFPLLPAAEWSIDAQQTPVSAVLVWGPATVRGRPSWVVVSGNDQGLILQWDLLPRGGINNRWDAWPKIPTQRMAERAHLLSSGHQQAVTSLTRTASGLLSASAADGSIRLWNPTTGKVCARMDGFECDDNGKLPLAVLQNRLLLTGGNGPHVTVHDFASATNDDDDDLMENVDWDWDGEN